MPVTGAPEPRVREVCPFSRVTHHCSGSVLSDVTPEASDRRSCRPQDGRPGSRAGILLVNHGSHSATWRRMLLDVQASIHEELLAVPGVAGIRTAFMEYTEPSIASQLKAFDEDGVDRVIVVPLLLTVSNHSYDDIPVICGMRHDAKVVAALAKEGISRCEPRAEVILTPLLDYPKLVHRNIARRIGSLRARHRADPPTRDGLVLVGYGSEEFNDEWEACFAELGEAAQESLDIVAAGHCWCGHIVRYRSEPTIDAIEAVLARADRALVLPVLVAADEMFQGRIIGGAVAQVAARASGERVLYAGDAILPEPEVGRWIISIAKRTLHEISRDHA